jgi:CRISPR-associated protein Csb2
LRPTVISGDPVIEFGWTFDHADTNAAEYAESLIEAIRHVRAFGWGIDLAVGSGKIVERMPQSVGSRIHFVPAQNPHEIGTDLRVPRSGSLASLQECYRQYLGRFDTNEVALLESGGPLYQLRGYNIDRARPHVVFKLLDLNEEPARYPHAKLVHIAGMVRHVAIRAMSSAGKSPEFVNQFIRGKRDQSAGNDHKQISYIPLPSIGHEHADGIVRNVMLVAPIGMDTELSYLAERIDGISLRPEAELGTGDSDSLPANSFQADLKLFSPPRGKFIAERYLGSSRVWHSVTPVILDGHTKKAKSDKPDAIARETEKLICKALQHAGIQTPCSFIWQSLPFLKNTLSSYSYDRDGHRSGYHRPKHLKDLTSVHIRIAFEYPVAGPLAIGAGRHCGFGLMSTVAD